MNTAHAACSTVWWSAGGLALQVPAVALILVQHLTSQHGPADVSSCTALTACWATSCVAQSLRTQLELYWPSWGQPEDCFWRHEWDRHGTCAMQEIAGTEETYFWDTLRLHQKYDLVVSLGYSPQQLYWCQGIGVKLLLSVLVAACLGYRRLQAERYRGLRGLSCHCPPTPAHAPAYTDRRHLLYNRAALCTVIIQHIKTTQSIGASHEPADTMLLERCCHLQPADVREQPFSTCEHMFTC